MTFGNINIENLGFIIQSMNGLLDLPKRKGDTLYDWGDGFFALVDENDIYFGTRNIEVLAYWDNRMSSDFRESLQILRNAVTTEILSTDYGDYLCKIDSIEVLKDFGISGKTVKITFKELNPDLSGGLPSIIGESSVRIDGYDLINFGLLTQKVNGFDVPKLQSSKKTSYQNNYLSVFRDPPEVELKVTGIYVSKSDMASKLNAFNKLISKEGLRHFVHGGYGYQCYCPDGYNSKIKGNIVEISINLKVMAYYNIDEIVQKVIDEITIQASPQSDLMETDSQDPAFIKGKDTFKAADSDKLDGNDSTYFAKESDMSQIRDYDYAEDLETKTDF
ncbi:hypothetical protein [Joostella sp.]|uniref:hypothetical protein n=1 Tax=Joostella sp. TaxID=2231138 RepID=UPI003A91FE7F